MRKTLPLLYKVQSTEDVLTKFDKIDITGDKHPWLQKKEKEKKKVDSNGRK